jgi:hypothetical protein
MVKFFNFELLKKSEIKGLRTEIQKSKDSSESRPNLDQVYFLTTTTEGIKIPYFPLPDKALYVLMLHSDVGRTIINALKGEIFRNGYDVVPKFFEKCIDCGKEFKNDVDVCDSCGGQVRRPIEEQKLMIEKRLRFVNENRQTILDVLAQTEDDLNILDNGFILFLKQYFYDAEGNIMLGEIHEILRGDPRVVRIIADKTGRLGYNDAGLKVFACPECRDRLYTEEDSPDGKCVKCHKRLYRTEFCAKKADGNWVYYLEGEAIHLSKYNPELLYGYPPVISVWQKLVALVEMDRYIMLNYQKQRPPRGLLVVNTANAESARKAWEYVLAETRRDPHAIAPWIIENKDGKNVVQWVDLMTPLSEMQYTEVRNEMRHQIGALYGVMPLFQGDLSTSGGLNNEGLQVTVTNRAVERAQTLYNENVFKKIAEEFNVTDYDIQLNPSEEKDEMAPLQKFAQKIDNALKMKSMGFTVEYTEDGQEFKYSQKPVGSPPEGHELETEGKPTLMTGEQRFSGEPENISLSAKAMDIDDLIKLKNAVTSTTAGAWHPRFRERKRRKDWQKEIKSIITKEIENLEKSEEVNLIFKQDEVEELTNELSDTIFRRRFEGLDKPLSEKAKSIVVEGLIEDKSLEEMKEAMKKEGISEKQAETIARTESQALQLKAREFFFRKQDPEEEYKYKWINPNDDRTSDICKSILSRTLTGVPLSKLRKIVNEESKKAGLEPRDFVPHPNCRSSFVRIM